MLQLGIQDEMHIKQMDSRIQWSTIQRNTWKNVRKNVNSMVRFVVELIIKGQNRFFRFFFPFGEEWVAFGLNIKT